MTGTIFFVVGLLMAVFHRAVGIGFCKIGKRTWKDNPLGISTDFTDKMYDERKTPRIALLMGVIFMLEGIFFWLLPRFIK